MNRRLLLTTAPTVVLLLLTLMPSGTAGPRLFLPSAQAAAWDKSVLQGWFFAPPTDGTTTATVAQRASWIAVSRTHTGWHAALREAGYRGDVVEYLMAMEVQGPGPYPNSAARCDTAFVPANNTAAYNVGDFCRYVHPNESWFLHNGRGERIVRRRGDNNYNYQMNPVSSGWRTFLRQRAARDLLGDSTQAKLGYNGLFFDNLAMRLYKLRNQNANSDGTVREYSDDATYRRDVVGFLAYQRAGLAAGGRLWGSLIDFYGVPKSEYLKYTDQLDGYMIEAWGLGYYGNAFDATRWSDHLSLAETTLGQGKQLMTLVQGPRDDATRQTFGLASYLLVSDGQQAYFRYAFLREPYTSWWQYDNYGVALGAPKGARYQSGNLWRRDFTCGYVTVDPLAQRGTIVRSTCSNDSTTPISLPGRFQAEDYLPGKGIGYFDTTAGNQGGAYRTDDVDIQRCADGTGCYAVSHIMKGEWLAYKVNITATGDYTLRLRIAATDAGQKLRVEVDGQNVTGTWTLPGTGSWTAWTTTPGKQVRLAAGTRTFKVVAETGWFNLNYLDVQRVGD